MVNQVSADTLFCQLRAFNMNSLILLSKGGGGVEAFLFDF